MKYRSLDILRLVKALVAEKRKSLTHWDMVPMYEELKKTQQALARSHEDYLYKLYLNVKDAGKRDMISLKDGYIDALARLLKFDSYEAFLSADDAPILTSCLGSWYSYVRCNSGSKNVLISPVNIYMSGTDVHMLLKGPSREFQGVLKTTGDCVYAVIESGKTKHIHLVFKIGRITKPDLLQGVFSGISSGGDPIAGREILIRQKNKVFEELRPKRVHLDKLIRTEPLVANYFEKQHKNILKGGRSSTFTIDDLEEL